MSEQVQVTMPLKITHEMLQAVREDPLCHCENKDEMNLRIGWLICAYEVLTGARNNVP